MRRILFALLLLGAAGALAELLLLDHTDGWWQRLPLLLLSVGILISCLDALRPTRGTQRLLRVMMACWIAGGMVGLYQHYSGNLEFELEMNPARHGFELVREVLTGATPALAPATMIYLGLVGLAYGTAASRYHRPVSTVAETGEQSGA